MKTVRILVSLMAMASLTFAVACGDDDGGNNDPEVCTNGVDDNGNGLIDCADPACFTNAYCVCDNDGVCDAGENNLNCPNDCPATACDNDGVCDAGENNTNCPNDCPATACNNNGSCDAGETTANCPNDCPATGQCTTVDNIVDTTACDTGEKCTVTTAEGAVDCVSNGTVGAWGACTFDQSTGIDNCLAGHYCQDDVCAPACDETHACPTGSTCSIDLTVAQGVSFNICAQSDTCDPFDATGCTAGEGCYIVSQAGDTICGAPGNVAIGGSCTYVNDCGIGALCAGSPAVCSELCLGDGDCTSGTCQGIGTLPGHATLGLCQ